MKRIFNLLAVVAVALSFTACHPLDNTYKELGDLPTPGNVVAGSVTLTNADYAILPTGNYAKTSFYFKTLDDAKASIPTILASKYPNYKNASTVAVTYANVPPTVTPADSVFANIAYTLVDPADYLKLPGNTRNNLSASQVLSWLAVQYPNPVANQLVVLTFNYFEAGATAPATQSFLYTAGAWTKLYHVSLAQYASVGKGGTNNNFATADNASIPAYLNAFLKADPSVMFNVKVGDVKYVSYKHFKNATGTAPNVIPAVTSQRVTVLTYDGTNWVTTPSPSAPLTFAKTNNVWVPDNTVNYQLTRPDHDLLTTYTFGTANARANLLQFGSVDLRSSSGNKWLPEEIAAAVAEFAKNKYKTPEQNQIFNLYYYGYTGTYAYYLVKLKYVGTAFVIQP